MARLALVVWTPDPAEAGVMQARIEESGAFEVLASPRDRAAFVRAVAEHNPDAVVVSSDSGHDEAFENLLVEAGRGRPPRSLVVVPGDYVPTNDDRKRAKTLQTTSISRSLLLRDDAEARENITARLRSLASRMSVRRRHTLDSDDLMAAMDSVIAASQRLAIPPPVAELAAWPVDLVLILGDPIAINEMREVLDGVYDAVVPVVVCIRAMSAEESAAALGGTRGAQPQALDRRGNLRELRGFFTAGWGELALQGERFSSPPETSSDRHPLLQACGLASGLVAIELSRTHVPGEAHARARKAGCVLTTLHPDDCAEPEVALSLIERGVAKTVFRLADLRWYLAHVVPRRG
jgi:methylmalonyl-CoA mutase cobalamin-binding subunit